MKKIVNYVFILLLLIGLCSCGTKKDRIIVYTCQEEERIQAMKNELEKKFPDLDVVVEQMGTGNLAAKIKSEGTGIEADIIIDLESSHLKNLKDNLADLSSFDTSVYLDGINPAHNRYVLWVKNHAAITIDKAFFDNKGWEYPTTYEDLLDPKYEGLIAMPDPATSGTGYAYYLNLVNLKGENGSLEYFRQLSGNIKQFTQSGSGPISLLKQGEIVIAMGMEFQGAAEITSGSDYKLIELETGAPYNLTGSAIISGREDKEGIKELFQWLISDFHYKDCEEFVPGKILKDQETKLPNFIDMKDADMKGVDNINLKEELLDKWDLS